MPRRKSRVAVCAVAAVEYLECRQLPAASLTDIALEQIRATGAIAFVAEFGSSREQVIAVIDTGLGSKTIPAENRWVNPGEIAGNGIDDDGNGYADDVSGWNFVTDTNDVTDIQGHGSKVSAEILLVDPSVKILPLKVGDSAIYKNAVLAAVQYAEMLRDRGVMIVAANMSIGGGAYDVRLASLFQQSEIVWVAAAGNEGRRLGGTQTYWPANYPGVLSVAAVVTGSDARAGYSNYGNVSVSAPGAWMTRTRTGTASKFQGTSAAAPAVAGAVSLAWRADVDASRDDVVAAIESTARPNAFTVNGMIDVEAAARVLYAGRVAA